MGIWLIIGLAAGAVWCLTLFWITVGRPVRQYIVAEHNIADFRREISKWEHDQCR